MATGNNNNNNGNIDFSDNRSSISKSGVSSSLQNKLAKQKFQSDFYREGSGYLDNNRRSLEDMQKNFSKLEKAITSLNKEQQKSIQKQLDALQKWSDKAKSIKENQNVSEKEATKFVEKSNEARLNAALEYQKITREIANNQDNLSKKEKKFAESLKGELDSIAEATQQVTDEVAKQNEQIERTKQVLKETQSNFAKGLSQTLKASSDTLSGLVNMFNINSLANSDVNKFFSSKLDMQNSIMKTFSMDTKQQYVDFKSDLNEVLNNMGDLYNANDLTTFMSNLSSMGITDTNIAQQLMKSSIQATKYLGMSEETQQVMFKWMKRTNDYDMLDKHNKTIVGILKSNLGISAEQLDALTTIAYSSNETMSAIGMSKETISAVNQASLTGAATLYGTGLDMNTVEEIQKAYQDFLTADIDELTKYSKLGMQDVLDIQRIGRYSTDEKTQQQNFIRFIESIKGSSALMNPNTYVSGEIQKLSGALSDTALSGIRGVDLEKWSDLMNGTQEEIDKAMKAFNSAANYISGTTEQTATDKIYNKLTQWFDGVNWNQLTGLAMIAFGLQASASAIDTFSSLAELKKLGGLKAFFNEGSIASKALTKLSGSGGLLATGGGILIGVAAVAAITKAIASWQDNKREGINKTTQEDVATSLKGTALEGNTAYIGASGIASAAQNTKAETISFAGSGISYAFNKLFKADRRTLNNKLTKWMYKYNVFSDELKAATWALMLASIGDLSAFNSASSTDMTVDDLKQLFQQGIITKEDVDNTATDFIDKGWLPYLDQQQTRMKNFSVDTNLDGYHKNGKDYIPRDGYHAILHKGEMVLNEREAEAYRKRNGYGGAIDNVGPHHPGYKGHEGIDLYFDKIGTPVGSAVPGTVIKSEDLRGTNPYKNDGFRSWGRYIKIKGKNGHTYIYGHLSKRLVSEGQEVNAGDLIGLSGDTGNSSGPHLHFQVIGAGTSEKDHANYYTPSIRNIGDTSGADWNLTSTVGSINSNNITDTTDSSSSTMSKPVTTGRFIPASMKSSTNSGGMGGAGLVTKSLDNNFAKLIGYLNEIRGEQSSQREMLNTFSKLNADNSSI